MGKDAWKVTDVFILRNRLSNIFYNPLQNVCQFASTDLNLLTKELGPFSHSDAFHHECQRTSLSLLFYPICFLIISGSKPLALHFISNLGYSTSRGMIISVELKEGIPLQLIDDIRRLIYFFLEYSRHVPSPLPLKSIQ